MVKNGAADGALAASVDRTTFPGIQGGPLMQVIAGKAIAFKLAAEETFRNDQRRTVENAAVMAETLAGLGARVVSGGTDNHLMLVDVTPLGVTGKEAEHLLDEIGITVNKNAIPFDSLPPNTASGIRVGTPAATSRGFGPDEMRAIGTIIIDAIRRRDEPAEQPASPARSATSSIGSRSGPAGGVTLATIVPRSPAIPPMTLIPDVGDFFIPNVGDFIGPIAVVFVLAAVIALAVTPVVRAVVLRYGIVDRPEARRVNTIAVPRGGGLAVCAAFLWSPGPSEPRPERAFRPGPVQFRLVRGDGPPARRRARRRPRCHRRPVRPAGPLPAAGPDRGGLPRGLPRGLDHVRGQSARRPDLIRFDGLVAAGLTIFWIVG